jgi:hypothetical protein
MMFELALAKPFVMALQFKSLAKAFLTITFNPLAKANGN